MTNGLDALQAPDLRATDDELRHITSCDISCDIS